MGCTKLFSLKRAAIRSGSLQEFCAGSGSCLSVFFLGKISGPDMSPVKAGFSINQKYPYYCLMDETRFGSVFFILIDWVLDSLHLLATREKI